ncbi:MAG: hypothetical protein K6G30_02550 [Acetatifactor sp.]|nr:hypothetical protein [Acetatifactor sp.]
MKLLSENELSCEIKVLEDSMQSVWTELEERKKLVQEGERLHVIKHAGGYQYYKRMRGSDTNGEYIRKKHIEVAETLAQIEYDEQLMKALKEAKEVLARYKDLGCEKLYEQVLETMSPGKRELVTIPHISDEDYLANWKKQEYKSLPFRENIPEFFTRQGLRVRSKSEVILADILDEMKIPFHYEKPLKLKNGIVHPDFTLLNIRKRREIYWEHFGMMDDMEYRNNAWAKIRNYEAADYYQPDSLIWTFETGKFPLNTKTIRKMIQRLREELGY